MNAFLASVGYDSWILPALLVIPLAGTLLIWLQGLLTGRDARRARVAATTADAAGNVVVVEETDTAGGAARQIAFWTLLIEFVVSAGLWWSFDPAVTGWQAVVDEPWIATWNATCWVLAIVEINRPCACAPTRNNPIAPHNNSHEPRIGRSNSSIAVKITINADAKEMARYGSVLPMM